MIRPPDHQPKYQLVFDELRKEIVSGKYKAGQKLPSEADLVRRFGASRITVGRAVRDLRQLGLVDRKAGSGTYVRPPKTADGTPSLSFGLLIPDLGRTEIFEPICQGMAGAPQAREHALIWCDAIARDGVENQQQRAWEICQQYIARKVSGVFFAPFDFAPKEESDGGDVTNASIVAAFEKAGIPVVLLDREFLRPPQRSQHDLVGIDNWRTGFMATEHLLGLGCERVAFLSYERSSSSVEQRIAGYQQAVFMSGAEPLPIQRLHSDDYSNIREIMETVRPDGFVCVNDRTAGHLMHGLLAMGIRIPGDVRIVGIDDIAYASLLPVPLTTIHQPCREIGIAAMATMIERVNRPQMTVRDVLLRCPLVVRDSCGGKLAGKKAAK